MTEAIEGRPDVLSGGEEEPHANLARDENAPHARTQGTQPSSGQGSGRLGLRPDTCLRHGRHAGMLRAETLAAPPATHAMRMLPSAIPRSPADSVAIQLGAEGPGLGPGPRPWGVNSELSSRPLELENYPRGEARKHSYKRCPMVF